MWNWTCSVFSAITVASNLAAGSLHIPTGNVLYYSYAILICTTIAAKCGTFQILNILLPFYHLTWISDIYYLVLTIFSPQPSLCTHL